MSYPRVDNYDTLHKFMKSETAQKLIKDKTVAKLPLGGGLSLYYYGGQPAYYEYRKLTSENGSMYQKLGRYDDAEKSFLYARSEADERRARVQQAEAAGEIPKAIKKKRTDKRLTNDLLDSNASFRSANDLFQFLQVLEARSMAVKQLQVPLPINADLYALIWLQLLYPNRIKELSRCKFIDFDLRNKVWYIARVASEKDQQMEFLSQKACDIIRRYRDESFQSFSDPQVQVMRLFSKLEGRSELEIANYTQDEIGDIWHSYRVSPIKHKNLFKVIAKEVSMFDGDFIDRVVSRGRTGAFESLYKIQLEALTEWWGSFLHESRSLYQRLQNSHAAEMLKQALGHPAKNGDPTFRNRLFTDSGAELVVGKKMPFDSFVNRRLDSKVQPYSG